MKMLNEGQFLHVYLQIYDNKFHVPSFPFFYCSPRPIKDSLPFHQPTPFIIISLMNI